MKKSAFLIALATLCAAHGARAEGFKPDSVTLHGLSYHTKPRPSGSPWNETNYGAGLVWALDADTRLQAGAYKDSVFKPTAYALIDYAPVTVLGAHIGAFAGLKSDGTVKPIAGGMVRAGVFVARIGAAPQSKGLVYTLELNVPFAALGAIKTR